MNKLSILLMFFTLIAQASMFRPIGLKRQITESSHVVQGVVLSKEALELGGQIVTKVELDVQKGSVGLDQEETIVEVYFDGGEIGNQVRKVHGAPDFNLGENVVVFLTTFNKNDKRVKKHRRDKLWINGIGLGKYSVKKIGSKEVMVNQIFPQDPRMGQIETREFYKVYERIKGKSLKTAFFDKYTKQKGMIQTSGSGNSGRSIASVQNKQSEDKSGLGSLSAKWYLFLLAFLVVIFGIIRRKFS